MKAQGVRLEWTDGNDIRLLQNGADVNIRDKFGNTPIMRTNRATPVELLHILLQTAGS